MWIKSAVRLVSQTACFVAPRASALLPAVVFLGGAIVGCRGKAAVAPTAAECDFVVSGNRLVARCSPAAFDQLIAMDWTRPPAHEEASEDDILRSDQTRSWLAVVAGGEFGSPRDASPGEWSRYDGRPMRTLVTANHWRSIVSLAPCDINKELRSGDPDVNQQPFVRKDVYSAPIECTLPSPELVQNAVASAVPPDARIDSLHVAVVALSGKEGGDILLNLAVPWPFPLPSDDIVATLNLAQMKKSAERARNEQAVLEAANRATKVAAENAAKGRDADLRPEVARIEERIAWFRHGLIQGFEKALLYSWDGRCAAASAWLRESTDGSQTCGPEPIAILTGKAHLEEHGKRVGEVLVPVDADCEFTNWRGQLAALNCKFAVPGVPADATETEARHIVNAAEDRSGLSWAEFEEDEPNIYSILLRPFERERGVAHLPYSTPVWLGEEQGGVTTNNVYCAASPGQPARTRRPGWPLSLNITATIVDATVRVTVDFASYPRWSSVTKERARVQQLADARTAAAEARAEAARRASEARERAAQAQQDAQDRANARRQALADEQRQKEDCTCRRYRPGMVVTGYFSYGGSGKLLVLAVDPPTCSMTLRRLNDGDIQSSKCTEMFDLP